MKRPELMPMCCGDPTVWVDNVPGKEYAYCRTCRHEVVEGGQGCGSCVLSRMPESVRGANLISDFKTLYQDPGVLPPASRGPGRYPDSRIAIGGHEIHNVTEHCTLCGMTRSERKQLGYPNCAGPTAMRLRRDGLGAVKTHNWVGVMRNVPNCTQCEADEHMFQADGDGPHCASYVRKPVAATFVPVAPPGAMVRTHAWSAAGHRCMACGVTLLDFLTVPSAAKSCPGTPQP